MRLGGVTFDFPVLQGQEVSGFSGGSVVKNPPANAGDTGSIPGLGRSAAEQLSLSAATAEPVLWRLGATTTGAH